MARSLNSNTKKILKAISDPSRYQIIKILMENDGTLCVNDIASQINITPSAVSHQLTKLEDMMLVEPTRKGQTVCYSIKNNKSCEKIKSIVLLLEE